MASSPWNKRVGTFLTKHKLQAPTTQDINIPTLDAPINLKLNGAELRYQDGVWYQGCLRVAP
jgi:hypothetical protein